MGSWVRRSGVVLTASDAVALVGDDRLARRLASLASNRSPGHKIGSTRTGASRRGTTEEEAIIAALGANALELVDAIPFETVAANALSPETTPERTKPRRSAPAATNEITIEVPLGRDEAAAILIEREGVYAWQFTADTGDVSTATQPSSTGKRGSAPTARAPRRARFRLELPPPEVLGAASPEPRHRRGALRQMLHGRVVALVFRFVARPALTGATRFLERDVIEGMVHVNSIDPADWKPLQSRSMPSTSVSRPARVLLLVHGTFSSTVGSFGGLTGMAEGRAWLRAALVHYDLVLGWEHRSLSVLPSRNADDLLAALRALRFAHPPQLDAMAFSRGGLVLRSLIERQPTDQPPAFMLGRAVFVGCTLSGTELARPANWYQLCDRYTNLATAGVRPASMLPGAAEPALLLLGALRGLGGLVKTLATAAVHDSAIPGLAAMDPAGAFVTDLNKAKPSAAAPRYRAITSNFDRKAMPANPTAPALPPGLLLRLADRGSDALLGQASDLVVHVASMTCMGDGAGRQITERYEFGSNREVHHCAYFSQVQTVAALQRWLEVVPVATPRRRASRQPAVSLPRGKAPKRRGAHAKS